MELADLASKTNIYDSKVLSLQRKLALTLDFRRLAVHKVCTNEGSKTPGIDGIILTEEEEKNRIVELMKEIIQRPESYKAKAVKRVFIRKGRKGKKRPLGIPTIKDRCLQSLINLILEPVVETTSDPNSYGFRKFRSAKMAIGAVRRNLRSEPAHYDKFVFDADIKGFFDNISHE